MSFHGSVHSTVCLSFKVSFHGTVSDGGISEVILDERRGGYDFDCTRCIILERVISSVPVKHGLLGYL